MEEGLGVETEDKDKGIEDRVKVVVDKVEVEVVGEVAAVIQGDIEVSSVAVAIKEDIMKQCKILRSICTTITKRVMQKDLKNDRIKICSNFNSRKNQVSLQHPPQLNYLNCTL